jgi:hypothetical protein
MDSRWKPSRRLPRDWPPASFGSLCPRFRLTLRPQDAARRRGEQKGYERQDAHSVERLGPLAGVDRDLGFADLRERIVGAAQMTADRC